KALIQRGIGLRFTVIVEMGDGGFVLKPVGILLRQIEHASALSDVHGFHCGGDTENAARSAATLISNRSLHVVMIVPMNICKNRLADFGEKALVRLGLGGRAAKACVHPRVNG